MNLCPFCAPCPKKSLAASKRGIAGHTVVLKLKSRDFKLKTRNRQLADPTQLADRIFRTGFSILEKEIDGTQFRLIGIGVSDLSDDGRADPLDLVDIQATKRAVAETAIDKLRGKFGNNAVETGYTFGKIKSRPGPRSEELE